MSMVSPHFRARWSRDGSIAVRLDERRSGDANGVPIFQGRGVGALMKRRTMRFVLQLVGYMLVYYVLFLGLGSTLWAVSRSWATDILWRAVPWTGITADQLPLTPLPLVFACQPTLTVAAFGAALAFPQLGRWRLILYLGSELRGMAQLGPVEVPQVSILTLTISQFVSGCRGLVLCTLMSIPSVFIATWLATLLRPAPAVKERRSC